MQLFHTMARDKTPVCCSPRGALHNALVWASRPATGSRRVECFGQEDWIMLCTSACHQAINRNLQLRLLFLHSDIARLRKMSARKLATETEKGYSNFASVKDREHCCT